MHKSLDNIRSSINKRNSQSVCPRCKLLTPKAELNCIHCQHLDDAQLQEAKIEFADSKNSISRLMLHGAIITALLLANYLLFLG